MENITKQKIQLFLVIILIASVIIFVLFLAVYSSLMNEFRMKKINFENFLYPLVYVSDTQKIEQIADNVSRSHIYQKVVYDCSEFSQELVNQLQKENYSAYCVSGFLLGNNTLNLHTWVEVQVQNETIPVEATGGFVISYGYYFLNYYQVIKGYCL